MNTRREEIFSAFKENKIDINKNSLEQVLSQFPGGVTNQFIKPIHGNSGCTYLVRINGRLWQPYTRENEHYNLEKLNQYGINTGVVANYPDKQFQICTLQDSKYCLSETSMRKWEPKVLKLIAKSVKAIHQVKYLKNTYSILQQLQFAYKKLSATDQKKLKLYYDMTMKLQHRFTVNVEEMTSSHNDLLSSSIYINKNSINIVDWEYAGLNHRSYDLAFFSIKSNLCHRDEQRLIAGYDPSNKFDMYYSVSLMKPIIYFLLLSWHIASPLPNATVLDKLAMNLSSSVYDLMFQHSMRLFKFQNKLLFNEAESQASMPLLPRC